MVQHKNFKKNKANMFIVDMVGTDCSCDHEFLVNAENGYYFKDKAD